MRALVPTVALAAMLIASACADREPAAPADRSVTNPELGLRLTALPDEFVVAVNQGGELELEPAEGSVGGRLTFEVGGKEHGINLVAAVNRHRRQIEEQPEAEYQGGQELVTPHGTAFYSRGRFLAGLEPTEETVVLLKHPAESRLLTIRYRYPAGADSSVRVQQLLDILGVLEGVGPADAASE